MARGREGMAKRAREQARQQRREAKRLRRETLADEAENPDSASEDQLMDEFRVLSERHAAGHVAESAYLIERHRIFVELGIEHTDE